MFSHISEVYLRVVLPNGASEIFLGILKHRVMIFCGLLLLLFSPLRHLPPNPGSVLSRQAANSTAAPTAGERQAPAFSYWPAQSTRRKPCSSAAIQKELSSGQPPTATETATREALRSVVVSVRLEVMVSVLDTHHRDPTGP